MIFTKYKKFMISGFIILLIIAIASIGIILNNKRNKEEQLAKLKKIEALTAQQYQRETIPDKKPSEYKVGKDYNTVIKTNKPVVVLFYADWCKYCRKFMPILEKTANQIQDIEFAKVNVEDSKYEKLTRDMGISGFPTVYIIDPKYDNKVLLSNTSLINEESFSKEINRFMKIRRLLDKK